MIGPRIGIGAGAVAAPRVGIGCDLVGIGNYPLTPTQLAVAMGFGTWTGAGIWLCNESSGNLVPSSGSPTLTANSLTYGLPGPLGGADTAIQFDAQTDFADGGANYDPVAGDAAVVYVGKWISTPIAATRTTISKIAAVAASGWGLLHSVTANAFCVVDGGGVKLANLGTNGLFVGEYHGGIGVMDRSTGKMRYATRGLFTGATAITAETTVSGDVTTAATLRFGQSLYNDAPTNFYLAYAAVVTGSSVVTGLSANLGTAVKNFTSWLMR